MFRHNLVAALALTLILGSNAVANDIYKWVDANGDVHYEDRPLSENAQRVAIESRATNRVTAAEQASATAQSWAEARKARMAARSEGASPEELRAAAEEQRQQCATYRETLQKMLTSRRLYREDGNGERVYLDDTQIDEARAKAQSDVEEYCNS